MRWPTRRLLHFSGVLLALALAGAAVVTAPDENEEFGQIEVRGRVGEVVSTRVVDVEVRRVTVGGELAADYALDPIDSSTPGVWVAVELTSTWNVRAGVLGDSLLRIGGVSYGASDILPVTSFAAFPANAGVPYTGSLVFEIPTSALTRAESAPAELVVRYSAIEHPDAVPVVDLDLASVDRVDVIDIIEATEVDDG